MSAWAVELLAARIANRDFGIPTPPRVEMVESEWIEGTSLQAPDQTPESGCPPSAPTEAVAYTRASGFLRVETRDIKKPCQMALPIIKGVIMRVPLPS